MSTTIRSDARYAPFLKLICLLTLLSASVISIALTGCKTAGKANEPMGGASVRPGGDVEQGHGE